MAGYEAALDLWQISGVQKATARLIEGLELGAVPAGKQGGGWLGGGSGGPAFNLHFLTVIPYFKVTEVRACAFCAIRRAVPPRCSRCQPACRRICRNASCALRISLAATFCLPNTNSFPSSSPLSSPLTPPDLPA